MAVVIVIVYVFVQCMYYDLVHSTDIQKHCNLSSGRISFIFGCIGCACLCTSHDIRVHRYKYSALLLFTGIFGTAPERYELATLSYIHTRSTTIDKFSRHKIWILCHFQKICHVYLFCHRTMDFHCQHRDARQFAYNFAMK